MGRNVRVLFIQNYVYDDSFFLTSEELTLTFDDAIELVNNDVAVITYIYE